MRVVPETGQLEVWYGHPEAPYDARVYADWRTVGNHAKVYAPTTYPIAVAIGQTLGERLGLWSPDTPPDNAQALLQIETDFKLSVIQAIRERRQKHLNLWGVLEQITPGEHFNYTSQYFGGLVNQIGAHNMPLAIVAGSMASTHMRRLFGSTDQTSYLDQYHQSPSYQALLGDSYGALAGMPSRLPNVLAPIDDQNVNTDRYNNYTATINAALAVNAYITGSY